MKITLRSLRVLSFSLILLGHIYSFAQSPQCLSKGQNIKVSNETVLNWKKTTKNQYLNRGHVQGVLKKIYPDRNGHHHFEISIGRLPTDTIEIVYNVSFGKVKSAPIGASFEACGDYITSNAATAQYPASPDGAIIHWVHRSNKPKKHDSGFIAINGTVYGK